MAEAFKIGEGYVEISSRVDRRQVKRDAKEAGGDFEEEFVRNARERIRKSRKKVGDALDGPEAEKAGKSWGRRLVGGIGKAIVGTGKGLLTDKITSTIGEGLMSFAKSPVGLAAIGALAASLGTLLASGLAASLSAALVGGIGLGGIGLAAFLLKDNKKIKSVMKSTIADIKKSFSGIADVMIVPFTRAIPILGRAVTTSLKPVLDALFKGLAPAIVPLAKGLSGMLAAMTPGLTALATKAGPFLIDLSKKLPGMGASIGKFFQKIADNWPKIQKGFFQFMGDVGKIIGVLASAFIWLASNYGKIRKAFTVLMQISNPVLVAVKAVYKAFKWLYDVLVGHSIVPDLIRAVVSWFAGLPGKVVRAIASLPSRVAAIFTRMASSAARAAKALPGRVKAAIMSGFGSAGSWLAAAGRRVISGFISGIESSFGAVRSKLGQLTNMIPDWKGPKSKDKKLLYNVGRDIISGLIAGFADAGPSVQAYLRKFTDRIAGKKVSARTKAQLQAIATSTKNALVRLDAQYDRISNRLTAAKDRYKELVAAAKDYAATIKSQTVGDITQIGQNQDGTTTGQSIVQGLTDRLNASKDFLANIEKLKAAGLGKAMLQQILDAGVEGGAQTAAALAGDLSQIPLINNLQGQLGKVGTELGKFGVKTFLQAGIDSAQGLIKGLESQQAALVKAIEKLAQKLIDAFKKKLKIKSPSVEAEQEVGRYLPPGVVRGVQKAMPRALRDIRALAPDFSGSMAHAAVQGPPAAAVQHSSSTVVKELHVHLQGILDPTNPAALRRLAAKLYELLKGYEKSYA